MELISVSDYHRLFTPALPAVGGWGGQWGLVEVMKEVRTCCEFDFISFVSGHVFIFFVFYVDDCSMYTPYFYEYIRYFREIKCTQELDNQNIILNS